MTLAALNPWQVLDQIQKEALQQSNSNLKRWHPATDINESENNYQITVDLPGIKPEDVNIEVHENRLTIKGERKTSLKQEHKTHYNERVYGNFNRTFKLPKDANDGNIEANFEHGVLTIGIPKLAKAQPRKVTINVS